MIVLYEGGSIMPRGRMNKKETAAFLQRLEMRKRIHRETGIPITTQDFGEQLLLQEKWEELCGKMRASGDL